MSKPSLVHRIRRGDTIPAPLAMLLTAASCLQRLGMWKRLRAARTRVDARVISFGNVTAGGTGKTPAVIERAAREVAIGYQVAVITRGYGSAKVQEPFVVTPDMDAADIAARVGDEPALIRRRVPQVYIVKSADRVAGARAAIATGCDTLLLDDGYQAVALERDENILLVDALNPFGNGRIMPRGILREPLAAMARATHVVLTRCDQAADLDALEREIRRRNPEAPIRRTHHAPSGLWRVCDGETFALDTLRGKTVAMACGIAHPEAFAETLATLGAKVSQSFIFPDHGAMDTNALDWQGEIVTTEKDAVRLKNPGENVIALGVDLADFS